MLAYLKSHLNVKHISPELIAFYIYKTIYQRLFLKKTQSKKILFIVGCQRSGSSIMNRVFTRDIKVKVYRESSALSSLDIHKLRLDPADSLKTAFSRDNVPLIVLKPMVESQNILTLLDQFPEAHALWLFRDYKDVASSNLKAFGVHNGINDLRPIVLGEAGNWRSENVSSQTRAVVLKYFSENMNPHDAAALFWFARNQLFFEQNLDTNPRVIMLRYEDFVTHSDKMMRTVYRCLGLPHPHNRIAKEVHPRSVRKGSSVVLSPEIESLSANMLRKLDMVCTRKHGLR